MPPKKSDPVTRVNRVRFVLLEADLSDNNFSELTQAITQALKPASAPPQRYLPPATRVPPVLNGNADGASEPEEANDDEEVDAESEPIVASSRAAKPQRKPKYAIPDFKPDVNITGSSVSFKDFATQQAPKSHSKRYLVAAIWMRDHGDKPTVNTDLMYTCYRTAGWPLGINDWDQTFRSLVKSDCMRRVSSGEYGITHIGEAALQKAGV